MSVKVKICNQLYLLYFRCAEFMIWFWESVVAKVKYSGVHSEESAAVYRILGWINPRPPKCRTFLKLFEGYVHPDIVYKDTVSLYSITETSAVFLDCGSVDVFDSKVNPFTFNAQADHAKKMIVLPLDVFNKVSAGLKPPEIPVIMLLNHGRCGSTLMSRLFDNVSRSFTVAETIPFTELAQFVIYNKFSDTEIRRLISSVIACTLKHAVARDSSLVFIKVQSFVLYISDLLVDANPHLTYVYMYRQLLPFVRSREKLCKLNRWTTDETFTTTPMLEYAGIGRPDAFEQFPLNIEHSWKTLPPFVQFSLIWITSTAAYKNFIRKNYKIKNFSYEELVKDPYNVVSKLFKHAGIKKELIPNLQPIMMADSQAGTHMTTRSMDWKATEHWCTEVTDAIISEVDSLCRDFKVGQIWNSDVSLPYKL